MYEQWAAASRGMRGRRCVLGAGDVAWGWRRLARTGRGVLVEAELAWGGQAPVAAIGEASAATEPCKKSPNWTAAEHSMHVC